MNKKGKIKFEEWARYADEDIDMARLALEEDGPSNQACFHSQQAAEKYLKGFIVYSGKEFEKSHLLRYLLELCVELDGEFEELLDDVIVLTQFYIETRYPGDIPEFSVEEAKKALGAAIRIKDFVMKRVSNQ